MSEEKITDLQDKLEKLLHEYRGRTSQAEDPLFIFMHPYTFYDFKREMIEKYPGPIGLFNYASNTYIGIKCIDSKRVLRGEFSLDFLSGEVKLSNEEDYQIKLQSLERFQRVNTCETIQELCKCILDFADERGDIQGRTRKFSAIRMSDHCFSYVSGTHDQPRYMTREFGIRQQAMYLKYSEHTHKNESEVKE